MPEIRTLGSTPQISVIIATYNWSSVLRHAIASVLDQSFEDFELLVVGDGCTDDSADVVAAFGDSRIGWHNLEMNSGNQSAPNNHGLELARGRFVAYLGHDDVWHPSHLETLLGAMNCAGADLVYSVTQVLGPPGSGDRRLVGLTPDAAHPPRLFAPPSAILHRAGLHREIGGWRDYRTIRLPPDVEFLRRAWEHGKKITSVNELTVFKFPSGLRPNSYVEKRSDEQAECRRRISREPDFRYRELMATLRSLAAKHPQLVSVAWIPDDVGPGTIVEQLRSVRGLAPRQPLSPGPSAVGTRSPENAEDLRLWNRRDDIAPSRFRQQLHLASELPTDGLFLGAGWHDLERDEWGMSFRWANGPAQLVVTRPSGTREAFWIEAFPGPGMGGGRLDLSVRDDGGTQRARVALDARRRVQIDCGRPAGNRQILTFTLVAEGGGHRVSTDPRILDFAVAAFDWNEREDPWPQPPPSLN